MKIAKNKEYQYGRGSQRGVTSSSAIQLGQQFVGSAQVWNDDAASHDQCHIQGFFLFGARYSQPAGLDDVIVDAIIATEAGRGRESHQLFVFGWNRAFQIRIVIEIIKALYEEVVSLIDIDVQTGAIIQKAARDFALVGDLLFGEEVCRFLAFGVHAGTIAELGTAIKRASSSATRSIPQTLFSHPKAAMQRDILTN